MKIKKLLIGILTALLVVLLPACKKNEDKVLTFSDYNWHSDSSNFKGWSISNDGNTITASLERINNRIWNALIENKNNFEASIDINVGEESSAYVKVLGKTVELDARHGNGNQVYVKGLNNENWLSAIENKCSISIKRKNAGLIEFSVKGEGNETIKTANVEKSEDNKNFEIGLYAGVATFSNIKVDNELLTVEENGWLSDSSDYSGWKSISKTGMSCNKKDATNNRIWKELIENDDSFTISLEIQVSDESSAYLKVLGQIIEFDARQGNGNQVYIKGLNNEDWLAAKDKKCSITIIRKDVNNIEFTIKGEGNKNTITEDVVKKEDSKNLELGVYEGMASFDKITYLGVVEMIIENNKNTNKTYSELARLAVSDNIKHWWYGDIENGYIYPTHGGNKIGVTESAPIWEGAMVLYNIYDMWVLTKSDDYKNYLLAEANYYKNKYKINPGSLENPAGRPGPASDDCAWAAMLYLIFYEVTSDTWFLKRCSNLCINAQNRWYDEELGGMRYSDTNEAMSLYETGLTLSWLRLYEITKDEKYYTLALNSYTRLHNKLYYDDGLYYIEVTKKGPVGGDFHISEGGSSSFLAGNMAMASIAAKLYKITNDKAYLDRVYKTNEGILKWYDIDGVLLNDRDAWTEGSFASYYASNVLTLENTEKVKKLFLNTALSIMKNARTNTGRYGGTWQGPAEGDESKWYKGGSVPEQIMTSGSSVAIVTASALLEANISNFTR